MNILIEFDNKEKEKKILLWNKWKRKERWERNIRMWETKKEIFIFIYFLAILASCLYIMSIKTFQFLYYITDSLSLLGQIDK